MISEATEITAFRLTVEQVAALDERATAAGLSRSEYIRQAVFGADPEAVADSVRATAKEAERRAKRDVRRAEIRADLHAKRAAAKLREIADSIDPATPTDSPNEHREGT